MALLRSCMYAALVRSAAAVCALVLIASAGLAQSLDEQLLADARDGTLDDFDFISAALIASGVADPCELYHWQWQYAERQAAVIQSLRTQSAPNDPRAAQE